MEKKRIPLVIIFMVVFIDLLGFGLLIPILPTFSQDVLHLSEFSVGLVLAIYSLIQFIFNPILGSLSDSYGRKNVIVVTLFINAAGYLLFAFTDSFLLLLISRVVCGIGGSSIGVAQAYIADITTPADRAKGMGLIGVAFGMGFVFGPFIGGVLAEIDYSVVGYGSMAFSLFAAMFSLFFLPNTNILPPLSRKLSGGGTRGVLDSLRKNDKFNIINGFKEALLTPSLGVLIMMFFVITFSFANIYGTFAMMGTNVYKFSHLENGSVFAILGLVGAIVQGGVVGRLSKRVSDLNMIIMGAFLMMIGLALLPYGVNLTGVSIIASVFSVGTGLLQPVLMGLISKVAPEDKQGSVLGINQSFSAFARMLGPLWGGFSFQYMGYQAPFLTGAAFTFLILIFSTFFLKKHLAYNTINPKP